MEVCRSRGAVAVELRRIETANGQNSTPETKRIKEDLQRLVALYEAWDKPEKAAEWKQRLAELQTAEPANDESGGIEKK